MAVTPTLETRLDKEKRERPSQPSEEATQHAQTQGTHIQSVTESITQGSTLQAAGINIPPVEALPPVEAPTITPAPEYQPSPEEAAWQEQYQGELQNWLDERGYGIPEETQQLMEQHLFDYLKADEQEQLRLLKNEMERRGLSNSGLYFYKSQQIRANVTTQMARGINEIQIQSSLMKLASFERAMGEAGNYLQYLGHQSELKYQAEFATWTAQQQAKMAAWQENLDRQKMAIAENWRREGMAFDYQLTSQLNAQQHQYDLELAQMKIEADEKAAKWGGIGKIFGAVAGFFLSLFFKVPFAI